jgi:putative DNA primase/helicase
MSHHGQVGRAFLQKLTRGLTGWEEGEAMRAAAEEFRVWQALHGKGNEERRQIAERLSGFIERHGDGRFSGENDGNAMVRDRAGWWWREEYGSCEYLLTAEAMREALRGFDFSRALDVLQTLGVLPETSADGKRTRLFHIGGRALRLYPVRPEKLIGDEG